MPYCVVWMACRLHSKERGSIFITVWIGFWNRFSRLQRFIPVVYGLRLAPDAIQPRLAGNNSQHNSPSLIQVLFLVRGDLWPTELPGWIQVMLFILVKDFFGTGITAFKWRFHANLVLAEWHLRLINRCCLRVRTATAQ